MRQLWSTCLSPLRELHGDAHRLLSKRYRNYWSVCHATELHGQQLPGHDGAGNKVATGEATCSCPLAHQLLSVT